MQAAVETRDLTRRFGALTAVDALTLRIETGEVFGLLGPNGSGKTTTIRMLCGLLEPSAGSALVTGLDVTVAPEQVKQRIGYMAQRVGVRSEEHTSELQSRLHLVCRLLLEKKKNTNMTDRHNIH